MALDPIPTREKGWNRGGGKAPRGPVPGRQGGFERRGGPGHQVWPDPSLYGSERSWGTAQLIAAVRTYETPTRVRSVSGSTAPRPLLRSAK